MRSAVLEEVRGELERLWDILTSAEPRRLEMAEQTVRGGVLAIGARLLEAGVAARGTGKAGARLPCACGAAAVCEGYRAKGVQTVVGWTTVRRTSYACSQCGHGHAPQDAALGRERDSHSPGVRRPASRFGVRLPFAQAADSLAEAAGAIQLSASTVRTITEAVGARREQELAAAIAAAWEKGLPAVSGSPLERLVVAMEGVRILGTDGAGREVKVGVVLPVRRTETVERRQPNSYVAGLEPADAFGRRLALEAHRRGGGRRGRDQVQRHPDGVGQ